MVELIGGNHAAGPKIHHDLFFVALWSMPLAVVPQRLL
jgi:hypothetical protein